VPASGSAATVAFPPDACLVLGRDTAIKSGDALAAAEAML
jgi:hypothetical protein